MDDTIYRQQVFDAFNMNAKELVVCGIQNAIMVEYYLNRVLETIKSLPPAQPEIVRCKDCKWHEGRYRCLNFDVFGFDYNDYCSLAERRENE